MSNVCPKTVKIGHGLDNCSKQKNQNMCVFSVNLVFKEEVNLMLEISDFQSRFGGLKLRVTCRIATLSKLTHLLYAIFIVIIIIINFFIYPSRLLFIFHCCLSLPFYKGRHLLYLKNLNKSSELILDHTILSLRQRCMFTAGT